MFRLKIRDIHASEIAEFLSVPLTGPDFVVRHPISPRHLQDAAFCYLPEGITPSPEQLSQAHGVLFLSVAPMTLPTGLYASLVTKQPRIDFIRIVDEFYIERVASGKSDSAHVSPDARIGSGVYVGEHVVLGPDVVVGNGTHILDNVVVDGRVEIGRNCTVKSNAVVGSQAYSFVLDERGPPLLNPHIGRIVWIGANTCIENPALNDTVIGNDAKIDDLVQIGHDCRIGERTMITAGVIMSHDVEVGDDSHIAPNASIRENVRIGRNAVVGLGSVVLSDVEDGSTYVGNPARFLKKNK
jgi:UDP-3-O-[3-hydroxymyristoyl] glucosamine N-acyltransferase